MRTYLIAFLLAAVVTVLITPLVRKLAPRLGAVDLPSGRRVNKRVIPRLGGIAILVGFLAPLAGLFFWDNAVSDLFLELPVRAAALMAGAVLMTILGSVDDLRGLRAWHKLVLQTALAVAAYAAGFRIDVVALPYFGDLQMGIFALPVTVLWIVGIINAVNLIDGLDGLAAGVAFFVCVVNAVVGLLSEGGLVVLLSTALGGALLGFLVFNFNPARIFMGDSGSMMIGYVLALTSLVGAKGSTAVALAVPILALGLPIVDTLLAVVRRVVERRPIFSPDKGHIHHRLLELGLTHRRAVLLLYGVTCVFTVTAIVIYIGRTWEVGLALAVSAICVFGLVRSMGSFQLRSLRRAQREGRYGEDTEKIRRALPSLFDELRRAASASDIKTALERFGYAAGLELIDCRDSGLPGLADWAWERAPNGGGKGEVTGRVRDYVSAKFQVGSGTIKFGWISETGDVSSQSEVLLRVIADEAESGIPRDLSLPQKTKIRSTTE